MEAEISLASFPEYSKEIKNAVAHILIFRERSSRLASRLTQLVDSIPKISPMLGNMNLHAKASIPLLTVTIVDLVEYFKMLSLKSPELVAHLLKYGSDEECFYKWNERLRLISQILGMTVEGSFDSNLDRQDKQTDVQRLRVVLPSLIQNIQDRASISKLLDTQETNSYKTVQEADSGVVIKAGSIKYDKLLGSGNQACNHLRRLWRSMEGKNQV